eukprot:SAG11_NODE_37_length_21777_cov_4.523711_2_plen_110_part_00
MALQATGLVLILVAALVIATDPHIKTTDSWRILTTTFETKLRAFGFAFVILTLKFVWYRRRQHKYWAVVRNLRFGPCCSSQRISLHFRSIESVCVGAGFNRDELSLPTR